MKSIDRLRNELDEKCKAGFISLSQTRELWGLVDEVEAEAKAREAVSFTKGVSMFLLDDEEMSEIGLMRLPVDADGVSVHIGDLMTYTDGSKPKEVIAVTSTDVYLCDDGPRYAGLCRHYQPDTRERIIEDVRKADGCGSLGEFMDRHGAEFVACCKAEQEALEILQLPSSYNKLCSQLEGEQLDLLHKAWFECQILTICQSIWHRKQWTCQAWRDAMHDWLMNCVRSYHERFDESSGDAE